MLCTNHRMSKHHASEQVEAQKEQFQQLTRPWRNRLYGVALRRTNSHEMAEDWVQETLLRAWKDFACLAEIITIYAWLLKILDHVIADDTRREIRRSLLAPIMIADGTFLQQQASAELGPFEQLLEQQTTTQVNKAIASLPDEFHLAILLRDIEGLSYREVADILNIPQGTVMSRLSRGRRLLATILIKEKNVETRLTKSIKNTGEKP